jgi:hypothetical protein
MADITTPDLLPGVSGSVVKKRLVDMGDGTFAEMTVTTLAASANSVGTVNLGSLGGAATAANQALSNATLTTLTSPYVTAVSTPLTATISDTTVHTLGPFAPQLSRAIWCLLNATVAASGTAQILRSVDGGATKVGLTAAGQPWAAYTFSGITGAIANEQVATETSALATYYLQIALTAGTVVANLHQ